jgi:hypothetical protein
MTKKSHPISKQNVANSLAEFFATASATVAFEFENRRSMEEKIKNSQCGALKN